MRDAAIDLLCFFTPGFQRKLTCSILLLIFTNTHVYWLLLVSWENYTQCVSSTCFFFCIIFYLSSHYFVPHNISFLRYIFCFNDKLPGEVLVWFQPGYCCGSMDGNVCLLVSLSVQAEISRQVSDGLQSTLVHTFMFSSGGIVMTLVIF